MLKIKITNSDQPNQIKEIELKSEIFLHQEVFIGRGDFCQINLSAENVSRKHGQLFLSDGYYYFADVNSSGGSWVNYQKVTPYDKYILKIDDTIKIGNFLLKIVDINSEIPTSSKTILDLVTEADNNPEKYMPVAFIEPAQILRHSKGDLTVRCLRVIDETSDVKTFSFVAAPPRFIYL